MTFPIRTRRVGQSGIAVLVATALVVSGFLLAGRNDYVGPHGWQRGASRASVGTIQRIDLTPSQKAALAELTNTPEKQKVFMVNLRKAFSGVVTVGVGPIRASRPIGSAESANYQGTMTVEPAFAQGWSYDHWWMTMSYADAAYGGIAAATAGCSAYVPWFVCTPIGAILASWVAGYSKASNHGVWVAVYRSGYITGGRW